MMNILQPKRGTARRKKSANTQQSSSQPVANMPTAPYKIAEAIDEMQEPVFAYSQVSSRLQLCSSNNRDFVRSSTSTEQSIDVMNIGDTPVDVFLQSFRTSGSEFISSAYLMQRSVETSKMDGSLYTSLADDIFTLVETQMSLLDEFLESCNLNKTDTGDAVAIDAMLNIFRILYVKQHHYRDSFFMDVDSCIAAANDFLCMSNKTEKMVQVLSERYSHLAWNTAATKDKLSEWDITTSLVEREASSLVDLFQKDAVLASERSAIYIIRDIQWSSIPNHLFSIQWEDEMTHNEVAKSIVRTYHDYLSDLRHFAGAEYLFHKVVTALVRATVCFYIQCFVIKADKARRYIKSRGKSKKKHSFASPERAVMRMTHDVEVFHEYFIGVVEGNAALKKIITSELSILKVVLLECMSYATGQNGTDSLEEFIVLVHKRTGADADITRHFLSDIFLLLGRKKDHVSVEMCVRSMKDDLDKVTARISEKQLAGVVGVSSAETNFRLDKMLKAVYEDRIIQEKMSLCGSLMVDVTRQGKTHVNKKGVLLADESEDSSVEGRSKSKWHQRFEQLKEMLDKMNS